jgi:hypothetical protein
MTTFEYRTPAIVRLLSQIEISDSGCWVWQGYRNSCGYGVIGIGERKLLTHRLAYMELAEPIPSGMELDHRCRVRACCNPDHLEPTTHEGNIFAPGSQCLGAINAAKTTCLHGHPYAGSNLYVDAKGRRHCRACSVQQSARYRQQKSTP